MKSSFKQIQLVTIAVVLLQNGSLPAWAHESETGVQVSPVRSEQLANLPGQILTAVTVNYEPGGNSTEHQHAGSVFAYVLKGAIKSENSATGPSKIYRAGDSFFEPVGSKHLVCENASLTEPASLLAVFVAEDGAELTRFNGSPATTQHTDNLPRKIFETMLQVPGTQPRHRVVHAKGIVCEGTFTPSTEAAELSKAVHFRAPSVPVIVRFSDGAPDPYIPDNSPNAGPRGMAIRFKLPGGDETDIVAMSHHGFVVGTGEEFLALQQAIVSTDPGKRHPWPIEDFLTSHPRALKFVQDNRTIPASFANEAFFSNNAFTFVNDRNTRQAGRYQIIPSAGLHHLSEADAKTKSASYLIEDLKTRVGSQPVEFRLVVQIPNPGDSTKDPSLVWPEDRRLIEVGIIRLAAVARDQDTATRTLAFDPINLTQGIELSDDPMPQLRSSVYALASKHRQKTAEAKLPAR